MTVEIEAFFDTRTNTLTYVVFDPDSRDAVVIDPVLDYEPAASKTWHESVDRVSDFIKSRDLKLHYVMETHAHADHLSGSQIFKERFPQAQTAIGARIVEVQRLFKNIFGLPDDFATDGRQFDRLFEAGEEIEAGSLKFKVLGTPGHTPACISYRFGDAVFTGDALFMPDIGTGRCDFPGGDAAALYRSLTQEIYSLPDETRIFVGHDYPPEGRNLEYQATVGRHKRENKQLRQDTTEREYVETRTTRDAQLSAPRLLFQSVQVNIDAGTLPEPADNEVRYLRIPINVFRPQDEGTVELGDARAPKDGKA